MSDAPPGGFRFDRTINLPALLTIGGLAVGALWWTAGQSNRIERSELALLALRGEMSERLSAVRTDTTTRLDRTDLTLVDLTRQTVEQWREIDRAKVTVDANERARIAADQRSDVQYERLVAAVNNLRELVARLVQRPPPSPQGWGGDDPLETIMEARAP